MRGDIHESIIILSSSRQASDSLGTWLTHLGLALNVHYHANIGSLSRGQLALILA